MTCTPATRVSPAFKSVEVLSVQSSGSKIIIMRRKNSMDVTHVEDKVANEDSAVETTSVKRMRKDDPDSELNSDESVSGSSQPSSRKSSISSNNTEKKEAGEDRRPDQSYAALITEAIKASPEGRLLLCDIYQWIEDKYPYFKRAGTGWKNSVRHNLSLHRSFFKEPRLDGDLEDEGGEVYSSRRRGRSSWWRLATPEEQQRQAEEEELQRRRRRGSEVSNATSESATGSSVTGINTTLPAILPDGTHHRPLLPKLTTEAVAAFPALLPYQATDINMTTLSNAYQAAITAAANTYFEMANTMNSGHYDQMVMPPPPLQQPTQAMGPITPQFLSHDVFLGALTPTSEGAAGGSDSNSSRRMRRQSSIYWGGSFDDNLMGMSATRLESPYWPFSRLSNE